MYIYGIFVVRIDVHNNSTCIQPHAMTHTEKRNRSKAGSPYRGTPSTAAAMPVMSATMFYDSNEHQGEKRAYSR